LNCEIFKIRDKKIKCKLEAGSTPTFDENSTNKKFISGQGV
jgi:hypothetical protein